MGKVQRGNVWGGKRPRLTGPGGKCPPPFRLNVDTWNDLVLMFQALERRAQSRHGPRYRGPWLSAPVVFNSHEMYLKRTFSHQDATLHATALRRRSWLHRTPSNELVSPYKVILFSQRSNAVGNKQKIHQRRVNTMKTGNRKPSCRWRKRVTAYTFPVAVLTFKVIHSQCITVVRHKQKS